MEKLARMSSFMMFLLVFGAVLLLMSSNTVNGLRYGPVRISLNSTDQSSGLGSKKRQSGGVNEHNKARRVQESDVDGGGCGGCSGDGSYCGGCSGGVGSDCGNCNGGGESDCGGCNGRGGSPGDSRKGGHKGRREGSSPGDYGKGGRGGGGGGGGGGHGPGAGGGHEDCNDHKKGDDKDDGDGGGGFGFGIGIGDAPSGGGGGFGGRAGWGWGSNGVWGPRNGGGCWFPGCEEKSTKVQH